jgi:hypothetical protein
VVQTIVFRLLFFLFGDFLGGFSVTFFVAILRFDVKKKNFTVLSSSFLELCTLTEIHCLANVYRLHLYIDEVQKTPNYCHTEKDHTQWTTNKNRLNTAHTLWWSHEPRMRGVGNTRAPDTNTSEDRLNNRNPPRR